MAVVVLTAGEVGGLPDPEGAPDKRHRINHELNRIVNNRNKSIDLPIIELRNL